MRAFVIRGFGQRSGVDFERVDRELIGPALAQAGIDGGGTTKEIVQAGNIRKDMFRELVLADIVVADVSVHNANVFYELGIRHAMQPRSTVLIHAKIDDPPFDLRTDRYLPYNAQSPGDSLDALVRVLRETLASEDTDSPVYGLLPELVPSSLAPLMDLPRSLREDIDEAKEAKQAGQLRLIAEEVRGLRFEAGGLREVARALEHSGDNPGARRSWERIRAIHPDDFEANRALADIYRRAGEPRRSNQALRRALEAKSLTGAQRAELYAGLGSNSKRGWVEEWHKVPSQDQGQVALISQDREDAFNFYRQGFAEDLNHWYSGLNALALAEITLELAARFPRDWVNLFDDDDAAVQARKHLESEVAWLSVTVRAAVDLAESRSQRTGNADPWIEISKADLRLLTSQDRDRVESAYRTALSRRMSSATLDSVRKQIEIYLELRIFEDNVRSAFNALDKAAPVTAVKLHPVIFSGHKFDAPGARPRFPEDQDGKAEEQIRNALSEIKAKADQQQERLLGLAGATDGGDLLFHKVCGELGIDTEVFLPVPELTYRATATSGRPGWAESYHELLTRVRAGAKARGQEDGVHILAATDELPPWLLGKAGYSIRQRSNRWILHHAWAATTVDQVTVLALWDGKLGNGPGGTADMVTAAQASGADVRVLETGKIFDLPEPDVPQPQPESTAVTQVAADSQETPPGNAERVLTEIWQVRLQWSAAADQARKGLNRWRLLNLMLLVAGGLAAAFAAQTWLNSDETGGVAALSAALLAVAGFVQVNMLTSDSTARWTKARAASEALKAEVYRYLARVSPYADADRAMLLASRFGEVQDRARDLVKEQQQAKPAARMLPTVSTFEGYVDARAREQASWHRNKVREETGKARNLRICQLSVTFAGVVLSAVAAALPGEHLAAWIAAATTVAAAFATHIAATQHDRIAASYAATADQIDRLVVGIDPKTASPGEQAQFVTDVERVLAAQNDGWVDLLSAKATAST